LNVLLAIPCRAAQFSHHDANLPQDECAIQKLDTIPKGFGVSHQTEL